MRVVQMKTESIMCYFCHWGASSSMENGEQIVFEICENRHAWLDKVNGWKLGLPKDVEK